jgi:CDP-glycerol glycerophosphotransferase
VSVTATTIDVLMDGEGVPEDAWTQATLASENDVLTLADLTRDAGGRRLLSFGKRVSRLGGPALPAPSGSYFLVLPAGGEEPLVAAPAPALRETLPLELVDPELDLDVFVTQNGTLRFAVDAPLAPEERGLTAQKRMQRAFRDLDVAPRDAVFFQCYRGEFATDSQRALDEALAASRPDLTRYWGVKDLATELPDGAVPVVIGSRDWYEALAGSRFLCNNIDFDGFFVKRPHQRYLQTFHGYPFKSMGRSFWLGKGWSPFRVDAELRRRNAEWDSILVPSEACADYYRAEYDYDGHVLVTGYPRSDFIVNADRAETRARVLDRLGVAHDKTVVLYAPTYRDNLTTRVFAAKIFDELDLDALTTALGEDYVVLLRGHNNNQRETDRVRGRARVVDVTDYPEINELTVAADAAVLDYSSLRFDWALTGRPAVFFVPDLDTYFSARPPLFDYERTAPGPLLSTTEEVAERLRNLDDVAREYAPAIAAFNEEFNGLHDGHATERVVKAFFADA